MKNTRLILKPKRRTDTLSMGLRQEWISGEGKPGLSFDLTCGAGLGSPYMILAVTKPDGEVVREVVDMRPVVTDWVNQVMAE